MLVILNHKCNLNKEEFDCYQNRLSYIHSDHQLVLCPSTLYLSTKHSKCYLLGSQDVSRYLKGSYTGEVSAFQLQSLNVLYSLVGHSERRKYFREDDKVIKEKLENLLSCGIKPILCVGEEDRYCGTQKIVEQLGVLKSLENNQNVVIAYEPVWAIGSGSTPTIGQIEEVVSLIKSKFPHHLVIYGGSVNEDNIDRLKSNLLDGYLLGGLSLDLQKLQVFLNKL